MNLLQLKASDPKSSAWVSASAGTGKTKILTDRVLRLLLSGTALNKILCLTFTNAAAGEMKERISGALANWSNLSHTELQKKLINVFGRSATKTEIDKASILYRRYLQADEGINIQTIHSFCQKLLKKFPLEAKISPGFKIIDDAKAYFVLQKIKRELLNKQELEPINEYLSVNFHEIIIDEIFSEIIKRKSKFTSSDNKKHDLHKESAELINSLDKNIDHKYQPIIESPFIHNIVGFNPSISELKKFFLTKEGQKKKRIVPKKIAAPGSSTYIDLERFQHQIHLLDQEEKSQKLALHSKILALLADSIITAYDSYKLEKGLLDYDDLIIHTSQLLKNSEAKEWVLYKLDGGIEHLLVDEAQDTSAHQWQIISSMIEEFYSGDEKERTIFVVGDDKQSIFSFQGADVDSFAAMNKKLTQNMSEGEKAFADVNLEISYRSAGEILEIVHAVFDDIKNKNPALFTANLMQLTPFRSESSGAVELWPLCEPDKDETIFWPATNSSDEKAAELELAKKISLYIKEQLDSKRIIPSTNAPIASSDFMILFRRRNQFTNEVIKALKNENLEVSGLDRISLRDNLAVLDLLSAAKFVINPEDDLNLACLLKSPIIGISEKELYNIIAARGKDSIWRSVDNITRTKLQQLIDIYAISNVSNFFQYITDVLGYRSALNESCGPDSNDAIDELLYACNNFASHNETSLQSFIFWLENYESSIKRDASAAGKIRIMTMHASKGLQAPIVILCDTTSVPTNSDRFIWDKSGKSLSAKNASATPEYYKDLKTIEQKKAYAEYLRLLYVGMTRAEDKLVVCGYKGKKTLPDDCWYQLVKSAMNKLSINSKNETLNYGQLPLAISNTNNNVTQNHNTELFASLPQTVNFNSGSNKVNGKSPLSGKDPMGYGLVFHKILEDSINAQNLSLMSQHPLIKTLAPPLQKRINGSIEKIIETQELANLLKNKETKIEVTLGQNCDDGISKIGRVDLMLIDENQIIIIDYKSDRHPTKNKIPENYQQQLSIYRSMAEKIYPNKKIRTMIMWLQTGKVYESN
ncbi:UvrD-helicase domain-containing protein [Rickettsiaceae bacterium]|nr:UvrD-helicase domain-containing protein [Rickettsiaceae bacterium]